MMRLVAFTFFLLGTGLLTSCIDGAYYEQNSVFERNSWDYKNVPDFPVRILDKTSKYDVYINLRHGPDYDFSNLFVLFHQKGVQLRDTAYRHEIQLAELDGRWLGHSAGGLYEVEYLVYKDFVFPDTGIYTFSLEQNMRQNPLLDVSDVGVKLVKK